MFGNQMIEKKARINRKKIKKVYMNFNMAKKSKFAKSKSPFRKLKISNFASIDLYRKGINRLIV